MKQRSPVCRLICVKRASFEDLLGREVTSQITSERLHVFRTLFVGRTDVYGTYNPNNKRVWQVKAAVTDQVLLAHLRGVQPCGLYPLDKDTIRMAAVDFDVADANPPAGFVRRLTDLGLTSYVERSKSKGYHVWLFFDAPGVKAKIARAVIGGVLGEMRQSQVEIFPKQDALGPDAQYGNFINLPLFGRLVPEGRAVFVDADCMPYPNQWAVLAAVERISEAQIVDSALKCSIRAGPVAVSQPNRHAETRSSAYALRPCAQRMLIEGVTANQRASCFRLACQLRKAGLPYEYTVSVLRTWAQKNRPFDGRRIISIGEVTQQTQYAYKGHLYLSCGCAEPSVRPFCDPACPIWKRQAGMLTTAPGHQEARA